MLCRIAVLTLGLALGCKTPASQTTTKDLEAGDGLVDPNSVALCSANLSSYPEPLLNYGVLGIEQQNLPADTLKILNAPTSADDSIDLIAGLFNPNCAAAVKTRIKTGLNSQPVDIYLYFPGYGGEVQPNNTVSDHHIIRWLNERDPNSIVIAIGWNCAAAEAAGHDFCRKRATVINDLSVNDPVFKLLSQSTGDFLSGGNGQAAAGAIKAQTASNGGYNRSLGYALEAGIKLVDHLLMASQSGKIGKIHSVGYSGGAHMVADILREDLPADGALPKDDNPGVTWTTPKVCKDGSNQCRLSEINQYGWSLAFGLSGWSHAMQTYNQLDAKGDPSASAAKRRVDYKNGGFIVPDHNDYNRKLRVVNRRMDPTGNADDQLQRGFNDILLSDYNHVSHDYSLPMLGHKTLVQALDAWLDASRAKSVLELGIIADLAADVNFDECRGTSCQPLTQYLAHQSNRQHRVIHIYQSPSNARLTDGIPTPGSAENKAVDLRDATAEPLILSTFDQEDLRGAVEFWYRPQTMTGKRSLFSYAKCGAKNGELQPRAYIDGTNLIFENFYRDTPDSPVKTYKASVNMTSNSWAKMFKQNEWVHLAFSWELPVRPIKPTANPNDADELMENKAMHDKKGRSPVFQVANPILAFPAGLKNNQPSSYLYQKGAGRLRIHVNGKQASNVAFGKETSARECLFAKDVVSRETYFAAYPAYIPYNKYDENTDTTALNAQISGQLCKAYKVLNTPVSMGCALDPEVTAGGDMDLIRIVFGEGRKTFGDVSGSGNLTMWDVGKSYTSKRRQRPN